MPALDYCVVDAFTITPFQGNPAAVVFGADGLTDSVRQQIAREFNLSETVFVLQPTARSELPAVRLRWFTPQCEVSFCGHATLAAIHAFGDRVGGAIDKVAVECAAGNLVVKLDSAAAGRRYWLSMPRPGLELSELPAPAVFEALRLPSDARLTQPIYRTRDRDVIVFVARGQHLSTLDPNMAALDRLSREHSIRGVSVACLETGDPDVACISRFFAPAAGIPEDPVTGSVHGPLAALLVRESHVPAIAPNRWSFRCRQFAGNGRSGDVYVRAESRADELAIEIGGSCVTVMQGRLSI
jgi:PhzF family phenazine biosynthesis protein